MSDDWEPSAEPNPILTLLSTGVVVGGAAMSFLFIASGLSVTTMGATRSTKIEWEKREAQIEAVMKEDKKTISSIENVNE